mgnify:CR=1 FL=1|jgi:uncharacterized protein (UPF0335 family)
MPRKRKEAPDRAPVELGELKRLLGEFLERYKTVENEIALLNEDRKNLVEEYEDRIDQKVLKQAIRFMKLMESVDNKDTFDLYTTVIEEMTGSGE